MFKNKNRLALFLEIFDLLIGGVFFLKANSTSGTTYSEEYKQGVRNALAEISFPAGDNAVAINASADNLSNFMNYRAGIQLNQTNKSSLQQTEQLAQSRTGRVTQNQLAQILTDVAFEKLINLSEADINYMADSLRGFNDPSLSTAYQDGRRFVRLRASGEGTMEPAHFISQVTQYRNNAQRNTTYSHMLTQTGKTALYNRIVNDISTRANSLTSADPNFFGGSDSKGMTPMQAMLITYSVVTNDMLAGNQTELQQKMASNQQKISQYWGQPYPSPQGRRAYGANGYIYSTPSDLLLDDAGITRVLTLIKERSNLQ